VNLFDYAILVKQFLKPCDPALTKVGPNAAWFDEGNTLDIVSLVKEKSTLKSPLTVMLDVNATPYQASNLLWKAGEVSSFLMVRIIGINHNTTTAQVTALRDVLNSASFYPGVTTLIVLGNEVNNLTSEWQLCTSACPSQTVAAGTAYGNLFRAFASGANFTAVPGPLDQYNTDYPDWQGFTTAAGVYGSGQTLVANVYDLYPNTTSDTTLYQQYQGNVVAFTEYGPSPFGVPLNQYQAWYANNPPPVPATTLVPDFCTDPNIYDGMSRWLYYIQGMIYDQATRQPVNVNCN
jgi:hypothetical protein